MLIQIRSSLRVLSVVALAVMISPALAPLAQAQDGPSKYYRIKKAQLQAQQKDIEILDEKIEGLQADLEKARSEAGVSKWVGFPIGVISGFIGVGSTFTGAVMAGSRTHGVARHYPRLAFTVGAITGLIAAGSFTWIWVEAQDVERIEKDLVLQRDRLKLKKQSLTAAQADLDLYLESHPN